jgi:6-phosphogluconate dehydrogenase
MLAMANADFGIIGLGVMGRNFLANVAAHGTSVIGYDVDAARRGQATSETGVECAADLAQFFTVLAVPRKIMLFVPENAVDGVIAECLALLEPGDLLVDGGNSHFADTERRAALVASKGVRHLGVGVSGGEEGARNGACIMAGGEPESYARVESILRSASAKVAGEPCCAHVGYGSAGHFVKMTHNGIEYAMMQVTAEAYDVMSRVLGMSARESSEVFSEWGEGRLGSFLTGFINDYVFGDELRIGDSLAWIVAVSAPLAALLLVGARRPYAARSLAQAQ